LTEDRDGRKSVELSTDYCQSQTVKKWSYTLRFKLISYNCCWSVGID